MPWPQDAYVGQKVICIANPGCACGCYIPQLIINNVFTIESIYGDSIEIGFTLKEIPTPKDHLGFEHKLFRPIQSTSTSYSLLAKLQDPSTHRDLDDVAPNSPVPEEVI